MRVKDFISKCIAKLALVSVVLSMFLGSLAPLAANAAQLTTLADIMSRQKTNVTADHEFLMTLSSNLANLDQIVIDLSNATTDFTLNGTSSWSDTTDYVIRVNCTISSNSCGGSPTTMTVLNASTNVSGEAVGSLTYGTCTTTTAVDVVVAVTTDSSRQNPKFGVKFCGGTPTTGTGISIAIKGGSAADSGSGTGTGTITNPASVGAAGESEYVSILRGTNPSSPTDSGSMGIPIISDDTASVTGSVKASLTFRATASSTTCDNAGSPAGAGGTVALGVLASSAIVSSDVANSLGTSPTNTSSITPNHICTFATTNASSGYTVSVRSDRNATNLPNTGSLYSSSTTGDTIASSSGAMSAGTAQWGVCVGTTVAAGVASTTPTGNAPSAVSPFNGTCTAAASGNVGVITTSAQNILSAAGVGQNSFAQLLVKATVSGTTPAHTDYTQTLIFIATGTF